MPVSVTCPAAELVHPVLSPNPDDIECRIAGRLRPAIDSHGDSVVCCANYTNCKIWQVSKRNETQNREARIKATQRRRARHTLSDKGHERESVRA